ncbi:MAG: hypothetical protein H7235_02805 [Bdellovibrionaceae bacterium]|nr:hypothetical protein [Pseudobdellovibrionaceae bacterium]
MKKAAFLGHHNNFKLGKLFSNQNGQLAIEAVLLMTVLLGAFLVLTKTIREKQIMQKFVSAPMERIGRMAGYGTWNDECRGQGQTGATPRKAKCHPNSIHRSVSSDPK